MEEIRRDNTIYYQQKQHHRQQLRQHILPQTIEMLEANQNPSAISRKACQSLYQDQLQKQLAARSIQRNPPINSPLFPENDKTNKSRGNSVSNGQINYRDYEQEKDTRIKQHIVNNYDGGSSFFRASEQHEQMRQKQLQEMGSTLKAQINSKEKMIDGFRSIKDKEAEARYEQAMKLHFISAQERQETKRMKQNCRQEYMRQMEEEKSRRLQHKKFEYKNESRHNPITNPIEYHIDNPYILKQIQENKMVQDHLRNRR